MHAHLPASLTLSLIIGLTTVVVIITVTTITTITTSAKAQLHGFSTPPVAVTATAIAGPSSSSLSSGKQFSASENCSCSFGSADWN